MYFSKFVKLIGVICFVAAHFTFLGSCNKAASEEEQAADAAESFANHFFNYELNEGAAMATTGSHAWISFFASNIDTATINLIKAQEEAATVTVDRVEMHSETAATAYITVSNFVWDSDIESRPTVIEKACFELSMSKEDGTWRVRMDSLRQNERQSRD